MNNIRIKDLSPEEKPRERLLKYGVSSLSNEELISIIIKTGTKNYSVKVLSSLILKEFESIEKLRTVSVNKLMNIKGIGLVKSLELISALELGKRVYYNSNKINVLLNNSSLIYEHFKDLFYNEDQEAFYAIYLDSKSKLISYRMLFKGTINKSTIHPREVFKYAFIESAYSIIIMHNHPSGDATPSIEDDEVTNSMFQIGKVMLIPVVDHIIFGNKCYYSYYGKNNIK
ncbi:MAG: DNA repair protein RadC [Tenericutes bacterium]|nr:DNA repair protein RadC [Mycoplasmatota bacterium]